MDWGGANLPLFTKPAGPSKGNPGPDRPVPSRPGNERAIMVGNVCAHVHSRAHNRTCARTEGPTGAPHVMLTQFRSVAQSGAGIQNKKRQ